MSSLGGTPVAGANQDGSAQEDQRVARGWFSWRSANFARMASLPRPGSIVLVALLLVGVLVGCGHNTPEPSPSPSNDGRFEPFTESIQKGAEVEIKDNLDSITSRMPGADPVSATWAGANREQTGWLPDRYTYWFHAVVEPSEEVVAALSDYKTGPTGLLPGIFEPLREAVPPECSWSQLSRAAIEPILIPDPTTAFGIVEAHLSDDCELLLVVGNGE